MYVGRMIAFGLSEVAAAAAFGAALALLGQWILGTAEGAVLTAVAALLGAAVLIRETVARRIPIPDAGWQVPRGWLRSFWGGAAAFGGVMGMGIFTRQPSALFHLYVAACILSADARIGATLGAIYGTTYFAGVVYSTVAWRNEEAGGQDDRLVAWSPWVRSVGALAAPLIVAIPAA
jgi:hypothetical protein